MLVVLLKMSKILVYFLSFFEKSVEFFAPITDWATWTHFADWRTNNLKLLKSYTSLYLVVNSTDMSVEFFPPPLKYSS